MLLLIPPGLHRLALRGADSLRRGWWRLRRPLLLGCRVMAFDGDGRLLLVRHSYGSGRWMLPGGGIARGEDPLGAALRELAEEAGCTLLEARQFHMVEEPLSGATNRVHLVTGRIEEVPRADGREIVALDLFALDALPPDLSPALAAGLGEWLTLLER